MERAVDAYPSVATVLTQKSGQQGDRQNRLTSMRFHACEDEAVFEAGQYVLQSVAYIFFNGKKAAAPYSIRLSVRRAYGLYEIHLQ